MWSTRRLLVFTSQIIGALPIAFQGGFIVLMSIAIGRLDLGAFDSTSATTGVWIWVVLGVAALASAALTGFLYQSWINKVGVEFEASVSVSIVARATLLPRIDPNVEGRFVRQAATGGARAAGRTMRNNLQGMNDLARAVVFLVACLVLSAPLTAAAIVLVTPTLLGQLALYRRVRSNERGLIVSGKERVQEVRVILSDLEGGKLSAEERGRVAQRYGHGRALQDLLTRYRRRLNTSVFAGGIASLTLLAGMIVAAFLLIWQVSTGQMTTTVAASFAFALFFFLQSLRSVLVSLALFVRQFAKVESAFLFISNGTISDVGVLDSGDDKLDN